jgi:hypothetical protein
MSEKHATADAKTNGTFPAGNAGISPPFLLYKSLRLKLQRGGRGRLALEPTFDGAALLRGKLARRGE